VAPPRTTTPRATLWRTVLRSTTPPEARSGAWLQPDALLVSNNNGRLDVFSTKNFESLAQITIPGAVTHLTEGPAPGEPAGLVEEEPCLIRWNGRRRIALAALGKPGGANTELLGLDHDRRLLVAITSPGRVYRREPSGEWVHLADPVGRTVSMAIVNDLVILGHGSGEISLIAHGRRQVVHAHGDQVTALRTLDRGCFLSGSRDGTVACWSHTLGGVREKWRIKLPGDHFVNALAQRRGMLWAGSASGSVTVLHKDSGDVISTDRIHEDSVRTLLPHPSRPLVLTSADDGSVSLTTFPSDGSEHVSSRILVPPVEYTRSAALVRSTRGGRTILLGCSQGNITGISLDSDEEEIVCPGNGAVRAVAGSPAGDLLVGRENGDVELRDALGQPRWSVHVGEPVFSVAPDLSLEGRFLVGTRKGKLAEIERGVVVHESCRHSSVLGEIRVHENTIMTCSDDRLLHATHRRTGTKLFDYSAEGLALNNILIHSSSDVYVTSDDGSVHQLTAAGRLLRIWRLHEAPVRAITEIDSGRIATGDRSGWVKIWSPELQRELVSIRFSKRVVLLASVEGQGLLVVTENEISVVETAVAGPDPKTLSATVDETAPQVVMSSNEYSSESIGHILHLSDAHFHGNDDPHSWVSPLLEDLHRELSINALELIVLSGDTSQSGRTQEFARAREFVEILRGETKNPRVLVVPGNHDMDWAVSRTAYRPVRKVEISPDLHTDTVFDPRGEYIEIARPEDLERRFSAFSHFHRQVTTQEYPLDPGHQFTAVLLSSHAVAVYGLNSNHRIDHHHPRRAHISASALGRLLAAIRREKTDSRATWIRIAVWHHPVDTAVGETIENPEVTDQLSKAGFKLLLHGHVHRPLRTVHPYDVSGPRGLVVVGAGTFGALSHEWTPGFPLGYNVLSVFPDRVIVSSRRRESPDGPWSPDARWPQGPGRDPSSSYTVWRTPD
jgi:WD40 repeat protein/predicted MPP superfamily phosphohydrolase